MAVLPGGTLISRLRAFKAGQNISADAPASHAAKQGTPTMGGLLILFSTTVVTSLYVVWDEVGTHRREVQDFRLIPVLLVFLAFGCIGLADDVLSVTRGKNLGLRAREKFTVQVLAAAGFAAYLAATSQPGLTTSISILPSVLINTMHVGQVVWDAGWLYFPLCILFLVGYSNATNMTDGLDGLLGGLSFIASTAMSALLLPLQPDLAFFCAALAGGTLGFLWWNTHPARVFMGDTGSLAIGAALATVAILGKQEVAVIVCGLVFWAELFSVMVQVIVFKYRRRVHGLECARAHRVFRRAPLHHHFEECGIAETQVVGRFAVFGVVLAAVALLWLIGRIS
jgi:phospho-N-acetylmuramoyl-pentapeptide-transferase